MFYLATVPEDSFDRNQGKEPGYCYLKIFVGLDIYIQENLQSFRGNLEVYRELR